MQFHEKTERDEVVRSECGLGVGEWGQGRCPRGMNDRDVFVCGGS